MKESIGLTGIFQIIILFLLLFTAIMSFTINDSNTFAVKNEILNLITNKKGNFTVNGNLDDDLKEALKKANYRGTGRCSEGYVGYDKNGELTTNNRASLCIKTVDTSIGNDGGEIVGDALPGRSFKIQLFYQLDLPGSSGKFNLSTMGETKTIYNRWYE